MTTQTGNLEEAKEHEILVEAKHLVKEFPTTGKHGKKLLVHAVSDVSFSIRTGETLALVGESGCGKSTLGRMLIRLLPATSGEVEFEGKSLYTIKEKDLKQYCRQMQFIFQDPYASLDPRMTVREILAEPLRTHKAAKTKAELEAKIRDLMEKVGIPQEFIDRYPHQFSGGQRQRIGIARAIALHPKLVVCDEPVSALDVSILSQILNLLKDLQEQEELTYLFISHDLGVVRFIATRVLVMYLGKVCEIADTEQLYEKPLHPYTRFLLEAIPKPDPTKRSEKKLLQGDLPSPVDPPKGCRFHTRCPYATAECGETEPTAKEYPGGHIVYCHHPLTSLA